MDEDDEREIYPEVHRPGHFRPEELLQTGPGPAPVLFILLIVGWLWAPFIVSVVFLVIILGYIALVETPSDLYSLRGVTAVGESLGLRHWQALLMGKTLGGLWDATVITKLWSQVMESSPALQGIARDGVAVAATQVDWVETGDAHVFKADMPGLKKEEVRVELEGDNVLQISGQRGREEGEDEGELGETWHRVERSRGRFLRRFQLPVDARVDGVQAKVEHGVLTVTVPKIRKQQPVLTRPVQIQ